MELRVSAVQFEHRALSRFEEFAAQVRRHVQVAVDFGARLVCFPEYVTGSLLTIPGGDGRDPWERWTEPYRELFAELAVAHRIFILGGTHLVREGERRYNTAHLFTPAGEVLTQRKLHLTPCEVEPWRLTAGERLQVYETTVGRLAVLVCFDVEFPEAARAAADAGADLILCPSATDDRAGFWRVRHCCHARAVENQVFVVHAALVGGVDVRYLEQSYGRSAIISPCDVPFARDGIVVEGEWNQGMVVTGSIDLKALETVRTAGSVTPRLHRRAEYPCELIRVE